MLIPQMLSITFPAVRSQLKEYTHMLSQNSTPLTEQGLASIADKEFHCLGGSVYALLADKKNRYQVLRFIVAFQTISDYLDNLCDRFGVEHEAPFRQLHTAMSDCFETTECGDYYALFPSHQDGGYLPRLVQDCRQALASLGLSGENREVAAHLTELYIHLQSYKHIQRQQGEELLAKLYQRYQNQFPGLFWWEFAAACGSTLGIFALVAGESPGIYRRYMPWVQGFHILLDYFIDQLEDREHGDMNFVAYYSGGEQRQQRLLYFYQHAQQAVAQHGRKFHSTVVDGLVALYLSDDKAWSRELVVDTEELLRTSSLRARVMEKLARGLRARGII